MNLFKSPMQAAPDDGAGGGSPSEELRSTLDAAFEAAEKPAAPIPSPEPTRPDPPDGKPRAGETPQQTAERVRDERGRFAHKAEDGTTVTQTAAAADAQAGAQPSEQKPVEGQPDPLGKAPQSWKPAARELWAQLTPEVKQEVWRREREAYELSQSTAPARQVYNTLAQLSQQYAPALQAEGVDIVTATQNLMGMVGRLRFGTPQERASTIVNLINSYGVDVEALDQALVNAMGGQGGQPVQPQGQQFADPRVDQLLGAIQQAQYQRVEAVRTEAAREVQTFGQGKDFFDDVREDMADILEVAARRGIDMTMEQAYERACRLNPEIDKVISQRAAAAAAQNSNGSTARARLASSSVRSTPANAPNRVASEQRNLRDEVADAFAAAETRGR